MKMKVTVVIPNWNGRGHLEPCLDSLRDQTLRANIVLVDNGSADGSAKFVKSNYADVHVIELPKNRGFAGGVNVGIKYALGQGADYIALFNNDAVADKNWLESLVETMEREGKIGIVSCKQLRSDGKHIDSTGDQYSIWGMPFPRGRNLPDKGQFDSSEEIFSAPAGATLYRAALLEDIGLFDEKFFAYYEDVDISFRARLVGWKIFYEPKAKVLHEVSATGNKLGSFTRYHATKNFYLLYAKNMPGWLYWKYLPLFTIQALRLAASSLLKGAILAYLRGVLSAFLLTPHIITERRRIQKSRKVSAKDIEALLYKHRPPKIPAL